MTNLPPGVTGFEYEIAGADYEEDSDETCPHIISSMQVHDEIIKFTCNQPTLEQGYQGKRWLVCDDNHVTDLN